MIADEYTYIAEEASNPNANDYREIIRMKGGKLIKELKHVKSRNVKQLLRKVKFSVLWTEFL